MNIEHGSPRRQRPRRSDAPAVDRDAGASAGELVKPESRRILLVEDDLDLREALAEALADYGHEVVSVTNGREALREMRICQPDVIVLDLMMPVMDGWQFRVEQKRDPALAETPVIAVSASHDPAAEAMGADLYLQKPLAAMTLIKAIEDVLNTRARQREPARLAQTDRMAALGTLAAGLAHEINNPLTYVLLHLSHAVQLLPGVVNDQNRARVGKIEELVRGALEGGERIRSITGGIRTFSRIDDTTRAHLDVRKVLEAAVKLVASAIRHRAQLVRDYQDVPSVLANEGSLGQVFLNLLTNALQAIREGDVARNAIHVTTRTTDDGRALIEITDTGEGIPPHSLGHIFEPFFSTKPVGQGTGLGLSISHGIIRSLGGEISVDSEVGQGTTFRVVLPAAHAGGAKAAPTGPVPTPAEHLARRRILVVDDEPAVCEAIRDLLGAEHEIVIANSAGDALEAVLIDGQFDVILCDLQMPDATGIDLYDKLMSLRPTLAKRMIFMTGGAFTEKGNQFLSSGKVPVLEKPLNLQALRALLAETPA